MQLDRIRGYAGLPVRNVEEADARDRRPAAYLTERTRWRLATYRDQLGAGSCHSRFLWRRVRALTAGIWKLGDHRLRWLAWRGDDQVNVVVIFQLHLHEADLDLPGRRLDPLGPRGVLSDA